MRTWLSLILICLSFGVYAQSGTILKDEIIVQSKPGVNARDLRFGIEDIGDYIKIVRIDKVAPFLDIYTIHLSRRDNNGDMMEQFSRSPMVIAAQYNSVIAIRKRPNDPEFNRQWALQKMDMLRAWDVTTGDNNNRAPIVVAILDSGVDRTHDDLLGQMWTNQDEIPGDNIDNDQNGYIDDYYGVNLVTGDDEIFKHFHGTRVAGIIGAKTDNDLGIAGVNWQAKLMTISLGKSRGIFESDIIEGMSYALHKRKEYNASGGKKGAFITALNFSLGEDRRYAASFKIICNLFDSLGQAGVLTIGATANKDLNIDEVGDLPCDCKSPYLFTVTNSDDRDKKVQGAGYGVIGIDVAAPGEDIYATTVDNEYSNGGGTSYAAPQLTGMVSLLYSLECDELQSLITKLPAKAALMIKEAIINSVDIVPGLDTITLSSGRINGYSAMQYVADNYCGNIVNERALSIQTIYPNPAAHNLHIEFKTPIEGIHYVDIIDGLGHLVQRVEIVVSLNAIQKLDIDVSDFACGSYWIKLFNDYDKTSKQVMICSK